MGCVKPLSKRADLGLRCPQMPEDTSLHGAAYISDHFMLICLF